MPTQGSPSLTIITFRIHHFLNESIISSQFSMYKHHRRVSSYWIPSSPPITQYLNIRQRYNDSSRLISSNSQFTCPRYQLENYKKYRSNTVSTTKYNAFTFFPKNLWEQFHRLANIYFVLIVVLNWIPIFTAVDPITATIPVVFIICLTALKDALEDLRRRRLDSKVNNDTCHVWDSRNGRFRKMQWKHVIVGDIVHLSNNEIIPADLIILRSSSDDGNAFLETSNLDGESNLKHRIVPRPFIKSCGEDISYEWNEVHINISCGSPSKELNQMNGTIDIDGMKESFSLNNVLLRGCRLKNTTFVEGIVIYAGHDTKMMLNSGRAPYKMSLAEKQTNRYVIVSAVILVILVVITTVANNLWYNTYPEYVLGIIPFAPIQDLSILSVIGNSIILYQLIIPLSMYITIELIKLGQAFLMMQDIGMYSEEKDELFIARSLGTGEELGQITHLLSDKTGTLTQNRMTLVSISTVDSTYSVEEGSFIHSNYDENLNNLLMNMLICNTVFIHTERKDVIEAGFYDDGVFIVGNSFFYDYTKSEFDQKVFNYDMDDSIKTHLEGESPDEIALVKGVKQFGYNLIGRGSGAIHYTIHDGAPKTSTILCVLPFDSIRKKMSVCIERDNDTVIIYTKGADSTMLNTHSHHRITSIRRIIQSKLQPILSPIIEESQDKLSKEIETRYQLSQKVEEYARNGLRTLVMGMKIMDRNKFDEWHNVYKIIEHSEDDEESKKMLIEMSERIEHDSIPIGVTAVQDELQIGVSQTISSLREAGIKIWILTGDKKETAEGVATSCGLFNSSSIHLQNIEDLEISLIGKDVSVSSQLIDILCKDETSITSLQDCSSVLCYRLTPSQKSDIVKSVRKCGNSLVAVIGDGANDVPMIQSANVGIGIIGSEGMQASMAADFVLSQFSFLSRLILIHGNRNYSRISYILLYFFYKTTHIVVITFFIQFFSGWSGSYPIDNTYSALYPIIFTSVQPILFGIYEQYELEETLLNKPQLYERGRKGQLYNIILYLINILDAFWQGFIVYFSSHLLMVNSDWSISHFGFILSTSMFFCNIFHLMLETRCWNLPTIVIHIFFIFVHFGYFILSTSIPSLENLFHTDDNVAIDMISSLSFWFTTINAVIIALFPRFVLRVLLNTEL